MAEIVDHQHAGIFPPHPDEAREIEHGMAVALAGQEEQRVLRIGVDERSTTSWPLHSSAGDQRADGGDHAAPVSAELFHGVDGRFQDAGQRALPARMRRADHARPGVDEQDRPAVGGGDADRNPVVAVTMASGLGPRAPFQGPVATNRVR